MSQFLQHLKRRDFNTAKPLILGGEGRPTVYVDLANKKAYQQVGDDFVEINPQEIASLFPSDVITQLTGQEPPSAAVDLEEYHKPADVPEAVLMEAARFAETQKRRRRRKTDLDAG